MIELDKDNFQAEVLDNSAKTLVFFSGDGCVPCEAIKPFVVECSEKYGDKIRFAKLNTSKARRLSMSQKVMGLPTIAIYDGGAKGDTITKEGMTEASIVELIEKHI